MSEYSVVLTVLGKESRYKADTLVEIFDQLKPDVVKGKAILVVSKGKLKAEAMLYPFQLKRLMVSKVMKAIWAKRLETRLQ